MLLINNSIATVSFLIFLLQFNQFQLQAVGSADSNSTSTNNTATDSPINNNANTTVFFYRVTSTETFDLPTEANNNQSDTTRVSETTTTSASVTQSESTRPTTSVRNTTNLERALYPLTFEEYERIKVSLYDLKVAVIAIGCFTGVAIVVLFILLIFLTAKRILI